MTDSSPLVNLVQAIHLPSHRFLLITSPSEGESTKVQLHLFTPTPSSSDGPPIVIWEGEIDLEEQDAEEGVLAEAIKGGLLHVDVPMTGRKDLGTVDRVDLKILPPDRDPLTYTLKSSPLDKNVRHLLTAAFELLARPPPSGGDKTELRALRAQISQKDDEISSLTTKLASAKATVVRATASDNKKVVSPQKKKAPANASALQPNAKRRKVVEDEFAGSDDE